jgi:hypothetical protein
MNANLRELLAASKRFAGQRGLDLWWDQHGIDR